MCCFGLVFELMWWPFWPCWSCCSLSDKKLQDSLDQIFFIWQVMEDGMCRLVATLPQLNGQRCPDMFRCTDEVSYWLHENEERKQQVVALKETISELQEELTNHRHRIKVLELQVRFLYWLSRPRSTAFICLTGRCGTWSLFSQISHVSFFQVKSCVCGNYTLSDPDLILVFLLLRVFGWETYKTRHILSSRYWIWFDLKFTLTI